MMAIYGNANDIEHSMFLEIYRALTYISGVFYYVSTCVNPLLYNIMSNKFREAFKSTLAQHCGLKPIDSTKHKARYSALTRFGASMRAASSLAENPAGTLTKNNRWKQSFNQDESGAIVMDNDVMILHNSGYAAPRHVIALTRHPHSFCRIHQLSKPSSQATVLSTISKTEGNNNNFFRKTSQPTKLHTFAERLRNGVKSNRNSQNKIELPRQVSHSESISNSSLQDLDEEEYSGSELARYMAQINVSIS